MPWLIDSHRLVYDFFVWIAPTTNRKADFVLVTRTTLPRYSGSEDAEDYILGLIFVGCLIMSLFLAWSVLLTTH
jgi:hypothetical protein